MDKKIFLGMFAAAGMLFATSCSNDELEVVQSGNEAQVTFSLGLEGSIGSRAAISDGTKADKLVYAVYKLNDQGKPILQNVVGSTNGQFIKDDFQSGDNVSITLAKGQTYQVAFWAQDGDCKAYNTSDLTAVSVSYKAENGTDNAVNNDELRDAFFKMVEFEVAGNKSIDVVLKRPFAQINVGVNAEDWKAAVASGIEIENSKVVIKNAATSINLLTGAVSGPTDITYDLNDIPTEILEVDTDKDGTKEKYNWLSMSYILAADNNSTDVDNDGTLGDDRTTLESLQFTFAPKSGNAIVFKEGLNSVPVQRNWRTNILGKILTGDIQFNITIDPVYDGDINNEQDWGKGFTFDEATKTYSILNAEGFKTVISYIDETNGFEGMTLKLDADIDLFQGYMPDGDPITTAPIGDKVELAFKGTFDGQGYTIKNLYQNGWALNYEWGVYGSIGLFRKLENATVKNVIIEDMEALIEGGDISFIAGSATGTCVFENITIKNSTIGTYNNGCGGIIGWSGAGHYTFKNITLGSDVVLGGLWGSFDSSIGGIVGQAEPGATYNFENVTINCRIDAYNDCTASYDYYNYRMCGMIIGRCEETTTVDGKNYPDLSKYNLSFNNVVVNYGDWMNYHYCRVEGQRAARVESGYAYGGISSDRDHSKDNLHCMECIPFNQLIGGDQYAVKGLPAVDGVTVNYPYADNQVGVFNANDLKNALESGKDIYLLQNIALTEAITVSKDFSLKSNGLAITNTTGAVFVIADNANVTINIEDAAKLTGSTDGITVPEGATLTIKGEGNLTVVGEARSGIGAQGTINIVGLANITAKGNGDHAFGIGGNNANVLIKNSTVDYACGGHVQPNFVNDTKYGKSEPEGGAAIGGAKIKIEGSTITKVDGGSKAAGIGAQYWQSTDIEIINSTIVEANGGNASAGIGGSRYNGDAKYNLSIKIQNSNVTATGGEYGAGIGSGYDTHCNGHNYTATNYIEIDATSTIDAKGGKYAAGIGTGYHSAYLSGSIATGANVTAQSGEKVYKDTYKSAQDIGYGVVDPAREFSGANATKTFTVNGAVID